MDIRVIAVDMDGTILNPNSIMSHELVNLFSELRKRGIKIFIATGRTQIEVNDVLPHNVQVDGIVTANGMGCYTNRKKITQYTLDPHLVHDVITEARNEMIYYEVHPLKKIRFSLLEDKNYMEAELNLSLPLTLMENEFKSRKQAIENGINWVTELILTDIVKVYFFSMDPDKINKWKNILKIKQEEFPFSTSSSSLHNVEIMVNHVTKATGVQLLLNEFNISPTELMAIGDGENDLSMFQLAGYSVAMKNAEEPVKIKANEVTKESYENNGLFLYLNEKFADLLNNY